MPTAVPAAEFSAISRLSLWVAVRVVVRVTCPPYGSLAVNVSFDAPWLSWVAVSVALPAAPDRLTPSSAGC